MKTSGIFASALMGWVCAFALAGTADAESFNIPGGDLKTALDSYATQTGQELLYAGSAVKGVRSGGAKGDFSQQGALIRLLSGTGFTVHHDASGALAIVPGQSAAMPDAPPIQVVQAAPLSRAAVETVTVTSSKLGGADVQSIPISITALSQEQLTATQTAGGPDLVKQVPNMTFTKTNFSGYSIELRGIGTQAISVTTPIQQLQVAFNHVPFYPQHFRAGDSTASVRSKFCAGAGKARFIGATRRQACIDLGIGQAIGSVRGHGIGRCRRLSRSPLRGHDRSADRR